MEFFCEINFSVYKNLHIEPFNYSIKSVRFDFHSAKVSSLVIKTGRREGSLLPYFMDVSIETSMPISTGLDVITL